MQKIRKTNERSLRYLKTDHGPTDQRTDQRTRAITKDPSGKPGVKKVYVNITKVKVTGHKGALPL